MKYFMIFLLMCVHTTDSIAMSGREIMEKNFYVGKVSNWQSSTTMTLIDKRGGKRIRKGISANKLQKNGIDYMRLYKFHSPNEIRGTGMLTMESHEGDDDMWIYMPALKKTRMVASSTRGNSFVGSDFSYGDIVSPKVDDFMHTLKGEEDFQNIGCYLVESVAMDSKVVSETGYSKRVSWIRVSRIRGR